MEMSSRLNRLSAAMRLPSCDEEQQSDVLEQQLDAFWSQDVLHGRFPQETRKETSLESQFHSGYFIHLPPVAPTAAPLKKAVVRHEAGCVVKGQEINDIPTSYIIDGLRSGELPVIGTYVDRRVVPGFRYRVRLNQSEKHLFEGRPLHLEGIGSGYGKRLSFESSCRSGNDNYFWSDSQPEGYGFKPVALWRGDRVTLTREVPGGADQDRQVDVIACVSQVEVSQKVTGPGEVQKRFQVKFVCRPAPVEGQVVQQEEEEDRALLVVAVAVLSKVRGQRRAKVDRLLLATQCSVRASAFVRN